MLDVREITTQLTALSDTYDELRAQSNYDDLGDPPEIKRAAGRLCTRTLAAAKRLLPTGSTYMTEVDAAVSAYTGNRGLVANPGGLYLRVMDVLEAFREDAEGGFLADLEASINAGVFADFLEMAEHVLADVHKTPAAVIAGFTLEEHLRKMCARENIPVTDAGQPRKANTLNADLVKAGAYPGKTEAKDVTAWLGRRNDAAHGHHDRYTDEQVGLMIEGVRGFISRHPA